MSVLCYFVLQNLWPFLLHRNLYQWNIHQHVFIKWFCFNFMMIELISSSRKVVCLLSFLCDLEYLSNMLPQQGSYIFGFPAPWDYQTWCSMSFCGFMWRVPLPGKWNTGSPKPWHQLPWTPLQRSRKECSIELMCVVWLVGLLLITCLKLSKILYDLCMPCL